MLKEGYITQEEHDQAVAQELVFVGMEAGSSGDSESPENIYSWYEGAGHLRRNQGSEGKVRLLRQGGQPDAGQRRPADLHLHRPGGPEKAEAVYGDEELLNYVSKSTGQRLQSAITIIDNETGDIAAPWWAGSVRRRSTGA